MRLSYVSTASINGKMTNAQFARIVGAQTILNNVDIERSWATRTNEAAIQGFQNIVIGSNTLSAPSAVIGINKCERFILKVNQESTLDFMPQVDKVSAPVTVGATDVQQSPAAELGAVVEQKET